MKKILWIGAIAVFIMLHACKGRITAVTEDEPGEPGNRNYVWKLDTLDMPMNYISSVWGASPNEVWAVGAGGTEKDRLMHYDGEKWSTFINPSKEPIYCTGDVIFGFAQDDVWMGGGSGWLEHGAGIWHYDGTNWSQHTVYDVEGSYHIEVRDIWGPSPRDIYACGSIGFHDGIISFWRGFVLHYDGRSWKELVRANFDSQFLTIRKENDKIFISSYSYKINYVSPDVMDTPNLEFYQLTGKKLERIYSNKESLINWASLFTINGKVYFVITNDVYRYVNGMLIKVFTIDRENFDFQICGRNESDLFLSMKDGLAHYNGTDIKYLYRFPKYSFMLMKNAVLFEKEVFFCGTTRTDFSNLVLHGVLNE